MTEATPDPCIRGCVRARRHITDCPGEDCRGCFPRPAQHGHLCYPCHSRLTNLLTNAPGQHALLLATAPKSGEQQLSQETIARIGDGWRLSNDAPHQGPYARGTVAGSEQVDPIRLAALDAAQALSDVLSEIVETVVEDYRAKGPDRMLTAADREDPRKRVWKPGQSYAYDKVVTLGTGKDEMTGYYVWVDPPARFEIGSASRWLLAQIERLEYWDDIGDTMEKFAEVMSQSHALAPWREQVARLRGIPCPECHRSSLVIYGGDEDVTCQTCQACLTPDRYAIWVRMLADEHAPKEVGA